MQTKSTDSACSMIGKKQGAKVEVKIEQKRKFLQGKILDHNAQIDIVVRLKANIDCKMIPCRVGRLSCN